MTIHSQSHFEINYLPKIKPARKHFVEVAKKPILAHSGAKRMARLWHGQSRYILEPCEFATTGHRQARSPQRLHDRLVLLIFKSAVRALRIFPLRKCAKGC